MGFEVNNNQVSSAGVGVSSAPAAAPAAPTGAYASYAGAVKALSSRLDANPGANPIGLMADAPDQAQFNASYADVKSNWSSVPDNVKAYFSSAESDKAFAGVSFTGTAEEKAQKKMATWLCSSQGAVSSAAPAPVSAPKTASTASSAALGGFGVSDEYLPGDPEYDPLNPHKKRKKTTVVNGRLVEEDAAEAPAQPQAQGAPAASSAPMSAAQAGGAGMGGASSGGGGGAGSGASSSAGQATTGGAPSGSGAPGAADVSQFANTGGADGSYYIGGAAGPKDQWGDSQNVNKGAVCAAVFQAVKENWASLPDNVKQFFSSGAADQFVGGQGTPQEKATKWLLAIAAHETGGHFDPGKAPSDYSGNTIWGTPSGGATYGMFSTQSDHPVDLSDPKKAALAELTKFGFNLGNHGGNVWSVMQMQACTHIPSTAGQYVGAYQALFGR